jgi:hypothetical protein
MRRFGGQTELELLVPTPSVIPQSGIEAAEFPADLKEKAATGPS